MKMNGLFCPGSLRHLISWVAVGALMGLSPMAFAADAAPTSIAFSVGSYEPTKDGSAHLAQLVAALKAQPNLVVVIHEATAGLKKSALPYIVERNRSLRVFQALVREGIDPARISYAASPAGKGANVAIETKVVASAPATKTLTPTLEGASANPGADFIVNFPSASAEPVNLSEERFQSFLSSVGQAGHDAVVIEGYTDSVGNATYNLALGELRALGTYERLIRAGLPPYRIDTKSFGKSAATPGKGDNQSDRRVVMRWVKNKEAAAEAAKVEAPPPPEPVAAAPAPEEPKPVETPPPPAQEGSLFDIVPFAGILMPGGELREHAKSQTTFGLGIGKALLITPEGEARITLFASANSKLEAKEKDRSGPLKVRMVNLRADYAIGMGPVRPFFGLGVGVYTWNGAIKQNSTGLQNKNKKNDVGGNVTLGLDFVLSPSFFLSPELAWHRVGGKFSETLYSGVIAARWRI